MREKSKLDWKQMLLLVVVTFSKVLGLEVKGEVQFLVDSVSEVFESTFALGTEDERRLVLIGALLVVESVAVVTRWHD